MASEDLPGRGVTVADSALNDGAACCIDVSLFFARLTRLPRG
jgi:hypothetical protein